MLEVEGPTSADAGVASCLLFNAEPVFRRLRDDLLDSKILGGMIRRGGNELQKSSVGNLSKLWSFRGADNQLELYGRKTEEQTGTIGQLLNSKAGVVTIGTKAKREFSNAKDF